MLTLYISTTYHLICHGIVFAVCTSMNGTTNHKEATMRDLLATILAPVLKLTGFRFSKDYRWGTTRYHRTVYAMVNTVKANVEAGL